MATYGYLYDEHKRYTTSTILEEREVREVQTFYREETINHVTQEKLCEMHTVLANGGYWEGSDPNNPLPAEECPDCVMFSIEEEIIKVPYEEEVLMGSELVIPDNCTLIQPLYADATWDGTKWIYDRDTNPPEEPTPTPYPIVTDLSLHAYENRLMHDRQEHLIEVLQKEVKDLKWQVTVLSNIVHERPTNSDKTPSLTEEEPTEPLNLLESYMNGQDAVLNPNVKEETLSGIEDTSKEVVPDELEGDTK